MTKKKFDELQNFPFDTFEDMVSYEHVLYNNLGFGVLYFTDKKGDFHTMVVPPMSFYAQGI